MNILETLKARLTEAQKATLKEKFNALTIPTPAPAPAQTEPVKLSGESLLSDGTVLKYDTEMLQVGSIVTVVTPDGELPAPEGEHTLQDGTVIKVVSNNGVSTVSEITPVAPTAPAPLAPNAMEQAIAGLTNQFAELTEKFNSVAAENVELKKELSFVNAKVNTQLEALAVLKPIVFAMAEIPMDNPVEPTGKEVKGIERFFNRKQK